MAARKRRHILAGVDGDPETNTVTYHYDVVYADDESDYPEVLRSYSKTVSPGLTDVRPV